MRRVLIATVAEVSSLSNSSVSPSATDPSPSVKALLFDMGGVLVELGTLNELMGLAPGESEKLWQTWLASDAVRNYERGLIDTATFAQQLVSEFDLKLTSEEFVERFRQFPRGLYPGATDLVANVSDDVITGILSNTNKLHWENQPEAAAIQSICKRPYLSYQLHMVKPDREIFDHIVADLGVPADQILFIDDNQVNVDGARAAGLRSEVTKGVEQATAVLAQYQLLD